MSLLSFVTTGPPESPVLTNLYWVPLAQNTISDKICEKSFLHSSNEMIFKYAYCKSVEKGHSDLWLNYSISDYIHIFKWYALSINLIG